MIKKKKINAKAMPAFGSLRKQTRDWSPKCLRVTLLVRSCEPFFFSSRRRHTRWNCDWISDVCSSDLAQALIDGFCESYRRAPSAITLDIDDTCDTVHGHQQLSLFNAHYDERCFLPI